MPPYAAPPPPPSPPSPLAQHARGASCDEDVQAWEWNCVDSGAQDMQLLTMSCTHHIYVGNLPISSRTGHTCMYITGAPVVATAAWSKALGSSGRAGRVEHQSHHAHAHASHESWDGRPMSLATTTTISTPNAGSRGPGIRPAPCAVHRHHVNAVQRAPCSVLGAVHGADAGTPFATEADDCKSLGVVRPSTHKAGVVAHDMETVPANQPPPNPPTTQPPHAPVRGSVFLSTKTEKNRVTAARSRLVSKTP